MKKNKRIGFVSIEVIIVAALIMASGFLGISTLKNTGTEMMSKSLNKLDILGIFTEDVELPVVPTYDSNGYDTTLNVQTSDINAEADFTYT